MLEAIPFQTRARTIDHLGREQIADCPTAISELWKNAFDAYARNVALQIFDGEIPVAVMIDDGHGMNREEFINKWLVVGTESKVHEVATPIEDRDGLKPRPKQGQKGIGRLSCANIGPLMLLVSKRRDQKFVASLIDWRLFENTYLNLSDIEIPVVEFEYKEQLFAQLPELFDRLLSNLGLEVKDSRTKRLNDSWKLYDNYKLSENNEGNYGSQVPSEEISNALQLNTFTERHLCEWKVWTGEEDHGTAMLMSQINHELLSFTKEGKSDELAEYAKERIRQSLTNFIDPYFPNGNVDFNYELSAWIEGQKRYSIQPNDGFTRYSLELLEHQIDGRVDKFGNFHGRIKAFGQWLDENVTIEAPKNIGSTRINTDEVGIFDFYVGTWERDRNNTTLDKDSFDRVSNYADTYNGLMIFRDDLRVLPFGRSDSDYFEIESRRSSHAGREFWNLRNMFGAIKLRRSLNPNLKDKAGREGLIDNTASKRFKAIVINILKQSARRYFGDGSDNRANLLPIIKEGNKKKKAEEERAKLRKKNRQQFRKRLKDNAPKLYTCAKALSEEVLVLKIENESDLIKAQTIYEKYKGEISDLRIPGEKPNLGPSERDYENYISAFKQASTDISSLQEKIDIAQQTIKPKSIKELLEKERDRLASRIFRKTTDFRKTITDLQTNENQRIRDLIDVRNKLFHAEAAPILTQGEQEIISFNEASKKLQIIFDNIYIENSSLFEPYIRALENMQENIDLEVLATFGLDENDELHSEIDRLNSLAQLGITVEIVGHDLEDYDKILNNAVAALPDDIKTSKLANDIRFAVEGLTDQLRFLSPLKLSGQKTSKWVSGKDIFEYVDQFFSGKLQKARINFSASEEFLNFRVFDEPSRLFPVFINLINNSWYWLSTGGVENRKLLLGVKDRKIIVADNGPGVEDDDIKNLFTMFFTRKQRGGRGVGLYLSRANLAAGYHKIFYVTENADKLLEGANFAIEFKGAEFNES